jgi:hypothetical protein
MLAMALSSYADDGATVATLVAALQGRLGHDAM